MPLLINVGLNRKRSRDFQSQGVSINVTAELDPALLTNPQRLQSEIAAIYRQAEVALDAQVKRGTTTDSTQRATPSTGGVQSNDQRRATQPPPRSVTQNQIYALQNLAADLGLDLDAASQESAGRPVRDLNIREASRLIDQLKARVHRARQTEHAAANGTHARAPPADHDQSA